MRRELFDFDDGYHKTCRCCANHDDYPNLKEFAVCRVRRGRRGKMKAQEHRYVRRRKKQELNAEAHC